MLRAVIVDDEVPVLNLLSMVLQKTRQVDVLQAFTDPFVALENICKIKPEVVFLDVEMPEMNGLELASRLVEQDEDIMVVFVTGYNQYALEAFRVNALDYILKPATTNSIEKCISRIFRLKGLKNGKKAEAGEKRITCFGDFEVYGNNGPVKWATRKVEEMLAYFIINRDSNVDGWVLGEILWPEETPDKVKTNLHTTLFRLRKTIKEEALPIDIVSVKGGNGVYRCSLGQLNCDLLCFESTIKENNLINKSNIDEFEKICALYRGDLFSARSFEWCEEKKEWLRQCYLDMLGNIADFYMKEGLLQNAINILYRASVKSPFDEVIHRRLLKLYHKQKNRALMIKFHHDFKERLIVDMSVEPQTETMELYIKLLNE